MVPQYLHHYIVMDMYENLYLAGEFMLKGFIITIETTGVRKDAWKTRVMGKGGLSSLLAYQDCPPYMGGCDQNIGSDMITLVQW